MARTTDLPERSYLSSRELDGLARSQTELLSELWILRDRVLVLEHLLVEAGVLGKNQLDGFEPPQELAKSLQEDRDALVARVVGAGHRDRLDLEELRKRP